MSACRHWYRCTANPPLRLRALQRLRKGNRSAGAWSITASAPGCSAKIFSLPEASSCGQLGEADLGGGESNTPAKSDFFRPASPTRALRCSSP